MGKRPNVSPGAAPHKPRTCELTELNSFRFLNRFTVSPRGRWRTGGTQAVFGRLSARIQRA